jgi:hypothetical protein
MPDRAWRIGLFASAIVLAALTYLLVERPIRFGKRARAGKAVALLGLLIIVGAAGGYVDRQKGLGTRSAVTNTDSKKFRREWGMLFNPNSDSCKPLFKDLVEFAHAHPSNNKRLAYGCRYADARGDETIAFLGDSMAQGIFDNLQTANARNRINTLVIFGQSYLNPVAVWDYDRHEEAKQDHKIQREFYELSLSTVLRDEKIRKVFLFLIIHTYGKDKEDMIGKLQKTVDRLHAAGKEVFFVTVPLLPFDLRNYNSDQPLRPKRRIPDVTISKALIGDLDGLARIKNMTLISALDAFCPMKKCLIFDNNRQAFYLDHAHLSSAGNKFLIDKVLRPYLER